MNNRGFSLIEVILALVIGAVIIAAAGIGIVNVTQGLLFTRNNAATTLKAQVALTRMEKEMHIITSIDNGSTATSFTFSNNQGGGTTACTLSQNGNYLVFTGATADNLVDNVVSNSLSFTYLQSDGTTTASPPGNAKTVMVNFKLIGADGVQSPFSMFVRPRNL